MGFSPLVQIFAVLFASHLSTDGLYGMDQSSYLWRGYGLSSQLFATLFMPLAVAYTFRALQRRREDEGVAEPIFFLILTLSSHFGIGYITLLSLIPLLFMNFNRREILERAKRLIVIVGISLIALSYWVIPFLKEANYNAISVWDPVWKFDSFGYLNVLTRLFHGELFDFGRLPIITTFTFIGFFFLLIVDKEMNQGNFRSRITTSGEGRFYEPIALATPLALLFPFWLLLFFGRATWGPLINLLPGAAGFHLHRFINGLHLSALFLAPVGAAWLIKTTHMYIYRAMETFFKRFSALSELFKQKVLIRSLSLLPIIFASGYLLFTLYQQTIKYATPNNEWIQKANALTETDLKDFQALVETLQRLPRGRIYAGKPGYWGKNFKVGDTQVYMALSTQGFEVSNFLPETWSPNSDTEQFFDERIKHSFDLYNLRYVVAPESETFPDFVKLKKRFGKYLLYETETSGYFTIGKTNLSVLTNRTNYPNLVHLWQIGELPEKHLYPILSFTTKGLRHMNSIRLIDPSTYANRDGKELSIFAESPLFVPKDYIIPPAKMVNEELFAGQKYQTTITLPESCTDCFVILKVTDHPNWKTFVDGKEVQKFTVFPFFIGIPVTPGTHKITADYQPSWLKILLLTLALISFFIYFFKPLKKFRLTLHR